MEPASYEGLLQVSSSTIGDHLQCQALWAYRKAGVVPLRSDDKLALGSLIHEALAHVLSVFTTGSAVWTNDPTQMTFVAMAGLKCAAAKLSEKTEYAATDFDRLSDRALPALQYHLPRMAIEKWETLVYDGQPTIELELGAVLPEGVLLTGRLDWVARYKPTGRVYLIDHKTTGISLKVKSPTVEHDRQLVIYRELLATHGIHIDGTLHHQVATSAPAVPGRNKDGSVSAQRIRSDWETVSREILRAGGDPFSDRYEGLRASVESNVFRRWAHDVTTPIAHARMWSEIREYVARMRKQVDDQERPIRNRGYNCYRCPHRAWCDADIAGLDRNALVGFYYHVDGDEPVYDWAQDSRDAAEVERNRTALIAEFGEEFKP